MRSAFELVSEIQFLTPIECVRLVVHRLIAFRRGESDGEGEVLLRPYREQLRCASIDIWSRRLVWRLI